MTLRICPKIYAFDNQYFYGEKVGVYLIEDNDKIVLFDIPKFDKENLEFIKSFNKPTICVLSHGSCGISDGTKWQNEIGLKVYLHKADENSSWLEMHSDILYSDVSEVNEMLGGNFELIHTPGHTKGSVCLLHKPSKSLFTGDAIYANSEGELYLDDNIEKRKRGLEVLLNYQFENIFPFHYSSVVGNANLQLKKFLELISQLRVLDKNPLVIAIDGIGGSGKSTLAREVVKKIPGSVIELDDFRSDEVYEVDRKRLISELLLPLSKKEKTKYKKWIWGQNNFSDWIEIEPTELIILEGLTSLHTEIVEYFDFKIWVEADEAISFQRGLSRDQKEYGVENEEKWKEVWIPYQREYVEKYDPKSKADFVFTVK